MENNKFQNGKIYRIISVDSSDVYIGSTTKSLDDRLRGHQSQYKTYSKGGTNNYCSSFSLVKNENAKIELVELFPCNTRSELTKREGYWIKMYSNPEFGLNRVNKVVSGRTKEEYYKDNIDRIKAYYRSNREAIIARVSQYNKDIGDRYKDYQKAYRLINKEYLQQYQKEYRQRKKAKTEEALNALNDLGTVEDVMEVQVLA